MNYIRTYTGRKFYPINPKIKDICIFDIIHPLSNICRFTGHTKFFYSVAQHCCYAYDMASEGNKFSALMHDSSEAYLSDIATPVKPFLTNYKLIESKLEELISKKFGYIFPYPYEVKNDKKDDIDTKLLNTEMKQLMNNCVYDEKMCYDFIIEEWNPKRAESEFLYRYNKENKKLNK